MTRDECERHRERCDEYFERTIRDLRDEIERRDGDRRADHKALIEWMVRVEKKVDTLPRELQDVTDRRFDRIIHLLIGLILSITGAGGVAYIGGMGGF